MDDKAGCKSNWYDNLYDVCRYSTGYSVPEAFYGPDRAVIDGCELQHKTFSYVDQRSGRTVRLYGIVDRYASGADADFLVSQIVSDILPFDRTTDHVLNNDPTDREIYCLLDEVLRKVYKVDLNSTNLTVRSSNGNRGDPRSPGDSPGHRVEKNAAPEVNSAPPPSPVITKTVNGGVDPVLMLPLNQTISEAVAQKLTVMEFLNFYKDIIERVDEAADADEKKYMAEMNQIESFAAATNQLFDGGFPVLTGEYQFPGENPLMGAAVEDCYVYKNQMYSPKRRNFTMGKKPVARSTSLPTISESVEKWWNEEGESLIGAEERLQLESIPDNAVVPQSVPVTFQNHAHMPAIEVPRFDDEDEFFKEVEKVAQEMGFIENNAFREVSETASLKSEDKESIPDYSSSADSATSYTAAAIVFIYDNKMFVGSIGDSRVILMRQKCHYLDIMYLNEPPLAWYPIAAAKNSYFKDRRYILYQEPIVRGGFLVNEHSIFLLMFNDGIIANMLNVNEYQRTSNEINRSAVHMVIKIIERYPSADIAEKFVTQIVHKCNRKYKPIGDITAVRREGMSFLFADLRQLMPRQPGYENLLKNYKPQINVAGPKVQPYPKMTEHPWRLENDEETMKHAPSMDKVYDMLQEIFEREENELRAQANASKGASEFHGEKWIVKNGFKNNGNSELASQKE